MGTQEKEGKDGSIMLGELKLILAAMRDRAYQPSAVEELEKGFIDAILRDDTDLVFKDECKFPVSNFYQLGVILRLTCSGSYGLDRRSPAWTNLLCLHGRQGAGDSAIEVIRLEDEE